MKKISPNILLIFTLLIASIAFSMINPSLAATRTTGRSQPEFKQLIVKLKKTTDYLARELGDKKRSETRSNVAVLAAFKPKPEAETGATKTLEPTPTLPGGGPRITVSASGRFAAEMDSGRRRVFDPNEKAAVAYSNGTYFLVQSDRTLAISNRSIKFVPEGGDTILNLPDYQDLNWNNTANLNAFRGSMDIVYSSKSNRLWTVNELGLEDYLRGIAEASHDSPEEHLKVMAILSRSYAAHHLGNGGRHASEPFHLKNSRNGNGDDQVYRGYTAETRQPRIAQAAKDTLGTVVTYQGKNVITPYSTQASGRTRSPAEAGWKVDWPWVQSVPDPDTAGLPRLGHGVGLSGTGSRKRAERGATAAEILGYYFPGTSLGQIDTSGRVVRVSIYSLPM